MLIQLAVSGGVAIGWFFIAVGIPCIALGVYLRKHPEVMEPKKTKGTGKKQPKKSKGKKSKRQPKEKDKPKDESTSGGASLIWGGLGMVVLGVASIAYAFLK